MGGERHTCQGESRASHFIKERFQPFSLLKSSFEKGKRHKLIIMVESAIIKKSLLIHRLPTAGRWGLNKRSQCRVDLGEEDAPCIHSHRGLCHRASVGSPSHLPAGHLPEKLPLPPDTHGTPAQGQYPIEGFRMLGVLTSLLSLFPLLRLTLASLPSPNSPFSLTVYFPAREPFATVGPLILPSRFAEPAVLGLGRC